MKNNIIPFYMTALSIIVSCSSDPCKDGYTEVKENGQSLCLPDYVVGIEQEPAIGNKFYHRTYGIVVYEDGKWFDQFGVELTGLKTLSE
ncbi:MAG: hypothetical protein R2819_09275 [Allomuricauda sp.]